MDKRELETRKKVGAVLFAFAGLCLAACISIIIMFPESFEAGSGGYTPAATTSPQIHHEKVDLQTMLDDLETNALRAKETYQDKYIEVAGEIRNFDSDGKYISIIPCGSSALLIDSVMCYLTDASHKDFLLEKSVGDVVTIRGKVFSIGEVLGYSIKIIEIND